MSRSGLAKILFAGVLLGIVAWALAYRYYTTRPAYLLDKGRAALERGDGRDLERQARHLSDGGHAEHLHLLRGST